VFVPKLVTTLKDYNRQQFANDLTAGVIVGIVALPLRSRSPSPAAFHRSVG